MSVEELPPVERFVRVGVTATGASVLAPAIDRLVDEMRALGFTQVTKALEVASHELQIAARVLVGEAARLRTELQGREMARAIGEAVVAGVDVKVIAAMSGIGKEALDVVIDAARKANPS